MPRKGKVNEKKVNGTPSKDIPVRSVIPKTSQQETSGCQDCPVYIKSYGRRGNLEYVGDVNPTLSTEVREAIGSDLSVLVRLNVAEKCAYSHGPLTAQDTDRARLVPKKRKICYHCGPRRSPSQKGIENHHWFFHHLLAQQAEALRENLDKLESLDGPTNQDKSSVRVYKKSILNSLIETDLFTIQATLHSRTDSQLKCVNCRRTAKIIRRLAEYAIFKLYPNWTGEVELPCVRPFV